MRLRKKGNYFHVFPNDAEPRHLTFSLGNRKLSERVLIFSLPAGARYADGGTCPMTCPGCYALKTESIFPSAHRARKENLELLQDYGTELIPLAVAKILSKYSNLIDAIRVHEGGDFFSAAYAWNWRYAAAAAASEGIPVYTYTKTEYAPILEPMVNVVRSILPNGERNYGPRDDLGAKRARAGLSQDDPTCPATLGDDVTCGKDCTYCHTMQYVLFVQH